MKTKTKHSDQTVSIAQVATVIPAEAEEKLVLEIRAELIEQIRTLAYHKWEEAGRPDGDGLEFWVLAEKEVVEWARPKTCCGGSCH